MIRLPHLETNITTACQLACRDCNHFVPMQYKAPQFASVKKIEEDLAILSRIAKADAYALIGGEPLIHPDLISILKVVRESGISDMIEVWTNGLLIERISNNLFYMIDRLVLSLYAGKNVNVDYIRDRCQESGTELQIKDQLPFTNVLHKDRSKGRANVKWFRCWYRKNLHVVDNGFFYRCCTSPFIPKLILNEPEGTDGIPLEGITEEALREFLNRSEPMLSCEVCGGHNGIKRPWKEVDRKEWIELTQI